MCDITSNSGDEPSFNSILPTSFIPPCTDLLLHFLPAPQPSEKQRPDSTKHIPSRIRNRRSRPVRSSQPQKTEDSTHPIVATHPSQAKSSQVNPPANQLTIPPFIKIPDYGNGHWIVGVAISSNSHRSSSSHRWLDTVWEVSVSASSHCT